MKTNPMRDLLVATILGLSVQPLLAHRAWLFPSQGVLSGESEWVTVDGAYSNNLFVPNHYPFPLETVSVIGPDGQKVELQNGKEGKYRSTFDVNLTQQGTYRITSVEEYFSAYWTENGERKRQSGSREELSALPKEGKEGLNFSESTGRIETFVTLGEPSQTALAPTGKGLELVFNDTQPNDLFSGEEATFTLQQNGAAAANVEVTIIKGDDRFRNEAGEIKVTTDAEGKFKVTWPEAGRYWVNVESETDGGEIDGSPLKLRSDYTAVFEVLPH